MSRYHYNKTTHELEPIAGYGSRVATSIDGKTLTIHSSILNIDGYNYGEGDIGAAVQMMATIESGMAATKNYAAGECFVYNAILYVVTEDVSDGDEFVVGENCALAPNLSDQINAVNNKADDAAEQLIVGTSKFYFDTHDGQYGYNTSAARGADTFIPFKNHAILFMGYFNGSFSGKDETVTCPIDGKLYYVFGGYVTSYAQIWVNGVEQTATANYKNETYGYKSIFEGIDVHKGDTVRRKFSSSGDSAYVDIGIVLG